MPSFPPMEVMFTIRPASTLPHVRQHRQRGIEHAPKVGAQGFLIVGNGHRFRRPHLDNARVVDEDVHRPKPAAYLIYESLYRPAVGHVAGNGEDLRSRPGQRSASPLQ